MLMASGSAACAARFPTLRKSRITRSSSGSAIRACVPSPNNQGNGLAAVAARHVQLVRAASGLACKSPGQELGVIRHSRLRLRGQSGQAARQLKLAAAHLIEEAGQGARYQRVSCALSSETWSSNAITEPNERRRNVIRRLYGMSFAVSIVSATSSSVGPLAYAKRSRAVVR